MEHGFYQYTDSNGNLNLGIFGDYAHTVYFETLKVIREIGLSGTPTEISLTIINVFKNLGIEENAQ